MSVNSSSAFNHNRPHSNESSSYSSFFVNMLCLSSRPASFIYIAFNTSRIISLLPLCIFILHHGFQQRKQKRSISSAATMSHSDCFTYHVVTMELLVVLGYIVCFFGIYRKDYYMLNIGVFVVFFVWYGELCFHVLTSVERYLAVVHPVTFLRFKNKRGVRFRNVVVGCVWLLCLAGIGILTIGDFGIVFPFCLLILSIFSVSFCSLSVLRVLTRPGPGDQGEDRARVDPSKQRALHTIVAILAVLLLKFAWDALWLKLYSQRESTDCTILVSDFCFTLPSSLVLPALFLHRAGKLECWKMPCCLKK